MTKSLFESIGRFLILVSGYQNDFSWMSKGLTLVRGPRQCLESGDMTAALRMSATAFFKNEFFSVLV